MFPSTFRLVSGAAHLLDNDKFSDLKIKCEDHQISAHKLVVCTPSDVLNAMCIQESKSNTIDLSDDTKYVVYRMVEFLYRGDYQELDHPDYQTIDKDILDRSGTHHAILHANMFAVADKYDIAALGDVAKSKFEKAIREHVSRGLFEKAITKTGMDNSQYLEVINYVYSTTPESNRGLRDVIVYETQHRSSMIRTDPVLNSRLEEIVSTTPQFAWDLIQSSLKTSSVKPCSGCKSDLGDKMSCSLCVKKKQTGGWFNQSPQAHDTNNTSVYTGLFGGLPQSHENNDPHAGTGFFGQQSQSHDTNDTHAGTGIYPSANINTSLTSLNRGFT